MHCTICKNESVVVFKTIEQTKYWKCNFCKAKFVDRAHRLDAENEKKRYDQHNNVVEDLAYRSFLSKLTDPLKAKLSPGDKGLDFGCGPGPALADMMQSDGYGMEIYDPFFFPNQDALSKKYDFITCTETAEHFFNPHDEFQSIDDLMVEGGWFGLMTCFMTEDELFEGWYYRRDPTHVSFYSEQTFEVIASQRNWNYEIPEKDIVLFNKN